MIKLLLHLIWVLQQSNSRKSGNFVSNEIIEILIDGTVTHAVNAPKMDLSNIDDTVKSFINLSQTVGELAIQLMYNAPSSIKIT